MGTGSSAETGRKRTRVLDRLSLRTRMVLITAAAVALIVAAGGVLLVTSVRRGLVDTADQIGEAQAEQIALLAQHGTLPAQLSTAEEVEVAAQVLRDGEVVSATGKATAPGFFGVPPQPPGADLVVEVARLPHTEGGPFRVTALGTATPQGPATVIVAVDVEAIHDAVTAFVREGLVALVLLTLAVAAVSWLVIGRTLAPVDAISRRAGQITGRRLDQRVPEPRTHDEIRRLARTINAMLSRLEESARRQERFVADAAHELRTPLATLRLRLETALDRPHPADADLLPDLLGETLRLGSLVEQLLLLARSDSGRLAPQVEPVDLDEVVTSVVASTQDLKVTVRETEVQPVQVLGEPALLEQVVRNLVENAARHAKSQVDVSLTVDAANAVITVDDDGPGIPADARTGVFERFVRLDDARNRDQGGVGLGLAIVDEIVTLHSGSVQVTESPAAGARLQVRLPAA
jgi:signal transduction histidine kinase